jgi:thiol-disulfide isomerase/thioredoxin
MIIELTPETYFEHVRFEGPLHVVMHYGATCGPCKMTMPTYNIVVDHFAEHNVTNVKFYRFHHWEAAYTEFINNNNLQTNGVPTFKYFYMGDVIKEDTHSYNDPNVLKQDIVTAVKAIESTMGGFEINAS